MTSFHILIGRQPILDRERRLVGHHVLLRPTTQLTDDSENSLSPLALALRQVAEMGMERMVGDMLTFVDADVSVLLSDFVLFIPNKNVVLILPASTKISEALLVRMVELRQVGFRFCLDTQFDALATQLVLMPVIDMLRVDVASINSADWQPLLRELKVTRKQLIATGVADTTQFERCAENKFDYYEGKLFTMPTFDADKKISAAEISIMQILAQISSDADNFDLESSIKKDAFIALNLLKMVNSSASGMTKRIGSLKQALQIIGRTELQCWLQILLYKKPGNSAVFSPLLLMASMRGKLLELMARKLKPNNRNASDLAFMAGIMSLMDTLFGMSMEELLTKITVFNEVNHALMERQGFYGEILKVAEYSEQIDTNGQLLIPALERLHLPLEDFYHLQLEAFVWADQIVHSAD